MLTLQIRDGLKTEKKQLLKILEEGKALISDKDLILHEGIVMGKDASVAEDFAQAVVSEIEKITKIK